MLYKVGWLFVEFAFLSLWWVIFKISFRVTQWRVDPNGIH
jgi:hypothetical protein